MWDNNSLPLIPGYTFSDPTKTNFGLHCNYYVNRGTAVPAPIIPTSPKYALELLDSENGLYDNTLVELTYGPRRKFLQKAKLPDFVPFDKQVLRFYGYFREEINDCWSEEFRIHKVKVQYYVEDDTIEIIEPREKNSGLPQGTIFKRQKIPHPNGKRMYLWKDLNIGFDMIVYGKLIQLVDCDTWTKEFLESSGITLNPKETVPDDPYSIKLRKQYVAPDKVSSNVEEEKLYKFLQYDRQLLRFYAIWDDTLNHPPEKRKVIILYYLADDTIEVNEVHWTNNGRDPAICVISRQKIPKDIKALPKSFPICYLEYSNAEVKEWFEPIDFGLSKTVIIFERKFFIYDCDDYTRGYYKKMFGIELAAAVDVEEKPKRPLQRAIPPYSGLGNVGSWEDSLQSCVYNIPRVPKKDMLKMLYNDDKFLRYSAYIDTVWPIDRSRKFVITFFPGDDTVQINEQGIPNSGFASGLFLRKTRLRKPEDTLDKRPVNYTAGDFYIGATIVASGRNFVITDADRYVLLFMEANPSIYSERAIEMHQQKTVAYKLDTEPLVSEKQALQQQMRQCVIVNSGEKPLPINLDLGTVESSKDIVAEKLYAANLPLTKELIQMAMNLCTAESGNVDVDELNKILSVAMGHTR